MDEVTCEGYPKCMIFAEEYMAEGFMDIVYEN
jgi:hypothetical protein